MATILVASGDDLAAKVQSAQPGDVVQLAAATWNLAHSFTIPSGVTLDGEPGMSGINFVLSGQDLYGIIIPANASNITIKNLDIVSTNGLIKMCDGSGYSEIAIKNNDFRYGGGTDAQGNEVFGIRCTIPGAGLTIVGNRFHDSPNSNRNWDLYYQSYLTIQGNTFFDIVDGGHVVEPGNNFVFDHNLGSQIRRMGQEVQGNGAPTGMQITNNTFYDWITPYEDSFGMSIVVNNAVSPLIQGNYIEFSIAAGSTWGAISSSGNNRFGYGLEVGGVNPQVLSNQFVILNTCGATVCSSSKTTAAKGNQIYDANKFAQWGDFSVESGGGYSNQATLTTDNQVNPTGGIVPCPNLPATPAPAAPVVVSNHPVTSTPTPPAMVPAAPPAVPPAVSPGSVPVAKPPAPVTLTTATLTVQEAGATHVYRVDMANAVPPKHVLSGTLALTLSDGSVQTLKLVL